MGGLLFLRDVRLIQRILGTVSSVVYCSPYATQHHAKRSFTRYRRTKYEPRKRSLVPEQNHLKSTYSRVQAENRKGPDHHFQQNQFDRGMHTHGAAYNHRYAPPSNILHPPEVIYSQKSWKTFKASPCDSPSQGRIGKPAN